MPKTIIEAHPKEKRKAREDGSLILRIAECFTDTVQGENFVGLPSTFLRMQGCTLNCTWCDSNEVWRCGNPYSTSELLDLWRDTGVIDNLKNGQHLVLTGGSPLAQQKGIIQLLANLELNYHFVPFIEIENECVVMPDPILNTWVMCWNNSPKLNNCGLPQERVYKPDVIKEVASYYNSWFKFVISTESDWDEIEEKFLKPGLIKKEQIVLMPEGATREELQPKYQFIIDMCIKHHVRMTDRLHITIWNKKVGV